MSGPITASEFYNYSLRTLGDIEAEVDRQVPWASPLRETVEALVDLIKEVAELTKRVEELERCKCH